MFLCVKLETKLNQPDTSLQHSGRNDYVKSKHKIERQQQINKYRLIEKRLQIQIIIGLNISFYHNTCYNDQRFVVYRNQILNRMFEIRRHAFLYNMK